MAAVYSLVLTGVAGAGSDTEIPRGAALWWACTQQNYEGPRSLACKHAYDPRYVERFVGSFDQLTPENEFKMAYLQPHEGAFDFSVADRIAALAQAHGKEIRGHTLVWGHDLPGWLTARRLFGWQRAEALALMRTHIETVVRHFAETFPGVVPVWDVVNEPLDENGRLADNFWARTIGSDYVERALVYARRADAAAKLVINEVDVERKGPKADALFTLVADLKRRGVPVDGVGVQMHLDSPQATPPYAQLVAEMRRYAEIGVAIEVTEMDVPTPTNVTGPGRNPDAEQAGAFERVARACRDAGNCTGFTTWGVADPYSWRGAEERALMFRADFAPKAQVATVRRILAGRQPAARARGQRTRCRATRPRLRHHQRRRRAAGRRKLCRPAAGRRRSGGRR